MLVDYHFHPNLSKYDYWAKRKCLKIWREFARQNVDVVVATEHVFKNPSRAYRLLLETRPTDAATVLFPGVEALTSEGIDIIIFSDQTSLYDHQKLMVPKQLNQLEMIQYIHQDAQLVGSIAHPASLAHSASQSRVGKPVAIQAIRAMGGAEIANSCLKGFIAMMRLCKLENVLKKQMEQCTRVLTLPAEYYDFPEVTLYTGGSDAHTLDEIGSGMNVPSVPLTDRAAVFQAIRTNQSKDFKIRRFGIHPYFAFYKLYTIIRESFIKAFRLYEGKIYQNDDAFTNYYGEAEKETVLAWRERRAIILKPVLNFLTYFSITPTVLTVVSFLLIIDSLVQVAEDQPFRAAMYFIIYMLANSLTGPLERYQRVESEIRAITHIALYQFALIAGVLAAVGLHWVDAELGISYLLLYTIMLWLIITLNKIGRPIHFVLRSKNVILAAIFLKITTGINWIALMASIFSAYMIVMNAVMLVRVLISTRNNLPPKR